MNEWDDEMDDEFISLLPKIIRGDRVRSVSIMQPSNRTHLHTLFSHVINLRTLTLDYATEDGDPISSKEEPLIELLIDQSLCNKLMLNGLQQLNLSIHGDRTKLINIAHLIVDRLPRLQVIELECGDDEVVEMAQILIDGLVKLNFVTLHVCMTYGSSYEKELRALCSSRTPSFRTEVVKFVTDRDTIFIWL